MQNINKILLLFLVSLIFISCEDDKEYNFEVTSEPEFRLFEMLDEYPALKSSLSDIDQHKFNVLMADTVNANIEESKVLLSLFPEIVIPTVNMINSFKDILGRVIEQDSLDHNDNNLYAVDFYSFLDVFFSREYNITEDITEILRKSMSFFYDNHLDKLEEKMALVIDLLKDDEGQNLGTILPLLQEGLVKILLVDDKSMILNDTDTDLGNSVKGVDSLIAGFSDIFIQDELAKKSFVDLIYSAVEIFTVEIDGKKSSEVLKEFMINVEKYATSGGAIYDNDSNYNNDSGGVYVNTNMINGTRELWPSLVSLFIKSKGEWESEDLPDYSVIYNKEGESVLEFLTHQFYQLKLTAGIDLSDENSVYGNGGIEKSLLRMVEYNAYGEKRETASYKVSYLDHLLYTLTLAYDFGYLTRLSSVGEPYRNHERGHGISTKGIMTLNDTLYSMTTGIKIDTLGEEHNAYSLALNKRVEQADYVFRSSEPFSKNEASQHKFYMGYDFPALALLNGFSSGDAGIPNGGNRVDKISSGGNIIDISRVGNATRGEDYKTYFSKVGNGLGELNTSRWVMGWIARTCWEGEGPYYSISTPDGKEATTTLNIDGTNQTVSIYYLPSGKIYAYVYKDGDRENWRYFYPINGSDRADSSLESWGELQQRTNRYRSSWHSDYFLLKTEHSDGDDTTKYYAMDSVVGQTGKDKYLMAKYSSQDHELVRDAQTNRAGAIWYYEKIKENDESRECDTQEEAMIRNFQWLMFEKKMVFTIPMRSYVHKWLASIDVDSTIMNIIEANGIQGIANAHKGPANGVWNIKGDEGLDIGTPQEGTGINYGTSYELGDSRVVVFMKEDGEYVLGQGDTVDIPTVYDLILGDYNVLPNIVGSNLVPITKMAFIENMDIASDSDIIGDNNNDMWKNRNKLFSIIVALISNLHESSYYDANETGYSYNYAGKHKYPLKVIRDLIFMLGQPLVRHFETEGGRWIPRMNDEKNINEATAYFAPADKGVDYRPKENLRSVTNILTESEVGKIDGFIPLIAKTKLVTKALNFLQVTGRDEAPYLDRDKTSNDYTNWGARRKIFYGLEQILTSIKTTEGIASKRGYFDLTHYSWFFQKEENDLDLDIILNELVGSDSLNKGIAVFVDNRPNNEDWDNFNFAIETLASLLSKDGEYGDKYLILDNMIKIATILLDNSEVTSKQLVALRHSLGVSLASYSQNKHKWIYHTEIKDILTVQLPEILTVFKGNFEKILVIMMAFTQKDGLVEYLLNTLSTESSSEDILTELYDFLDSDLISNYLSPFWRDLADLFLDISKMLKEDGEYHE